ncbi:hypothetical protein GCM10010399_94100 [Dactylosporangium fulvum]|uniref:DUF6232 family protein n=1 Tax=Dactylosporangium fulvum TaxID=53359 RepID=A0ABY5W2M1_9ACTN|nr:DUF6232 family protein [Dactylosporangium fulvum]UWP82301.1 DUF6232 family protein [Dactylosporangium fulvum]
MPTVFYQGQDVVITDDVFAVWKPDPQVYDLEALEGVRVEHDDSRPARFVFLVVGTLVAVGAVAGWSLVDGPGGYLVAAAVIAVPPVAGRALRILGPVTWSLKAVYSGAEVTLFASTNVIVFNRVRRSLLRAFAANAASVERLERAGYGEAFRRLDRTL